MELRQKNHFVPENYLKRWADSCGKIFVYQTLVSHERVPLWKTASPGGIAYHHHLYTQIVDGAESDNVERWLSSEFESPAAEVLEKATNDRRMTPDDWKTLSLFVALQDLRTPARMFEMLRGGDEAADHIQGPSQNSQSPLEVPRPENNAEDTAGRSQGRYPLLIDIEDKPEEGNVELRYQLVPGRQLWLAQLQQLLTTTARVLQKHRWTIVKPPPDMSWITSDNPVVRLNYYGARGHDLKGGWGMKNGNILFPLSPAHLLFTQIGEKPRWGRGTVLSASLAKQLQSYLVENAFRRIFADRPHKSIPRIRHRVVDEQRYAEEGRFWKTWRDREGEQELRVEKSRKAAYEAIEEIRRMRASERNLQDSWTRPPI